MQWVDVKRFHDRPSAGRVFGWQTIPASEALLLADPYLRCPECLGKVTLFAGSFDGRMPDRAEHRPQHRGCTLSDSFDGRRRLSSAPVDPGERSYRAGAPRA